MALKFLKLPLIEVAVRFALEKDLPLSTAFVFDLYEKIKSSFPELSDLPQLEVPPGVVSQTLEFTTQPVGMACSDPVRGIAVSCQRNMLVARWQGSTDVTALSEYPTFERGLLPAIEELLQAVQDLTGDARASVCNMYYTNFIKAPHPLDGQMVNRYLREFWNPPAKDVDKLHECTMNWRGASGVDLRITVKSVDGTVGPRPDAGYLLSSSGGKRIEDYTRSRADLLQVHDELCNLFERVITEEASKEWEKQ